ncbi:polysaccharide deacetylase family protein [Marinobacter fonticola]|uniref:polysaccharide deacetylase family protein n=1 Tax=Marinobacter fonticola TaxID=2603215 RepID=UPI001D0D8B7E|nr:polysaccharide deacetylase family protein [Marinobacter fonticola]
MFSEIAINFLTSAPVCRLMLPLRRQVVPVFLMHRFADDNRGIRGHSLGHLEDALGYLKRRGYHIISLRDLVESLLANRPLPDKAVAFTLDDGFYDQAEKALPVFERHQAPVTVFLATDMQDAQYWSWDYKLEYLFKHTSENEIKFDFGKGETKAQFQTANDKRLLVRRLRHFYKTMPNAVAENAVSDFSKMLHVTLPSSAPSEYQPITWDQARALESDYVEFGPHTKRHPILSQLTDDEAREEIAGSWQAISRNLKNPVPIFCFPSGREGIDFGPREQRMAAEAGLIGALSADPGYIYLKRKENTDIFALKRFSFPDTLAHFKQYCSWLEYAKERL